MYKNQKIISKWGLTCPLLPINEPNSLINISRHVILVFRYIIMVLWIGNGSHFYPILKAIMIFWLSGPLNVLVTCPSVLSDPWNHIIDTKIISHMCILYELWVFLSNDSYFNTILEAILYIYCMDHCLSL